MHSIYKKKSIKYEKLQKWIITFVYIIENLVFSYEKILGIQK
jgi:hypothetical protein